MFINVPNNVEKVNLLMSGGADSTLLLYLLVVENQNREKPYVIQNHTLIDRGRIDYYVVKPILNWFHERFGVKMYTKAWRYSDLGTLLIRPVSTRLIEREGGVMYTGCNAVPEVAKTWKVVDNKLPYRGEETHPLHFRPFIEIEKTEIIREYKERQILDLLDMTQSCFLAVRPETPPCGKCFFCVELAWAKHMNGL
jgi:hypothetical protein